MHKIHYMVKDKIVCGLRTTNKRKVGPIKTVTCKACIKIIDDLAEKAIEKEKSVELQ